jgi:hypothetical protein
MTTILKGIGNVHTPKHFWNCGVSTVRFGTHIYHTFCSLSSIENCGLFVEEW